jgi:hypothetical protein
MQQLSQQEKKEQFTLLRTAKFYIASFSSFRCKEESDGDVRNAALREDRCLLDAVFCPLRGKLLADDALALAAEAWLLFLAAGTSWLCLPSYVVITAVGSCEHLSICFFTSHPWYVHL